MFIRKIGVLRRTYRHMQRYRTILAVLFKYGFGDLVDSLHVEQYIDIGLERLGSRKPLRKIDVLTRAERVRMALEELGPTFVKMGQILSTRPDLLPVDFLQEFEKLQDQVAPFPYSEVRSIIESELDSPLEKIYTDFHPEPLASASLGQVHRARFADGEAVVVKVQRPDIEKTIQVDLEIALHLATLIEKHVEGWEVHHPAHLVEEFARTLAKELDYLIEAAHLERFAAQFTANPNVYVPAVYREATTRRVLTMEYVDGVKVSDAARLLREGLDGKLIARRGADLIMEQVFVHGYFHADPHPGNLMILPGNVICYLDFGTMGRLNRANREDFADLVMGIVRRDESRAVSALLRLTIWTEEPDRRRLERGVADFIDEHFSGRLKDLAMGNLLLDLLKMAARHRLRILPDLFLVLKALATVEGVGEMLDPDFSIVDQAAPFLRRVQVERYHPKRIAGDLARSGWDLLELLKDIPAEVRDMIRQTKQGKIRVEFQHRGLEQMVATHERISNRLAFSIVLASLVVGSALVDRIAAAGTGDAPARVHALVAELAQGVARASRGGVGQR